MEKYCVSDPNLIAKTVLNEPIDKDSFKDIFNNFNLIVVLPMEFGRSSGKIDQYDQYNPLKSQINLDINFVNCQNWPR